MNAWIGSSSVAIRVRLESDPWDATLEPETRDG
jgi:hypothetical protein